MGGDTRRLRPQGRRQATLSREEVRTRLLECGAVAVGFARAGSVDAKAARQLAQWVAGGCNAGMSWFGRHVPLRAHTDSVLPGVKTVISLAFSYQQDVDRDSALPRVSSYAWGDDYHDVLRGLLRGPADEFKSRLGGEWRICIDSAPLSERYWAMQAGIGRLGMNGQVIVDGYGSRLFLAEILTTVGFEPDQPSDRRCAGCGACIRRCPGRALMYDGCMDARRCLSYLTIEHRGEWPEHGADTDNPAESDVKDVLQTPDGRKTLYGCDLCIDVCPHNLGAPTTEIEALRLNQRLEGLTAESVASMTADEFAARFRGSAIKRCRLEGLRRNARNLR